MREPPSIKKSPTFACSCLGNLNFLQNTLATGGGRPAGVASGGEQFNKQ